MFINNAYLMRNTLSCAVKSSARVFLTSLLLAETALAEGRFVTKPCVTQIQSDAAMIAWVSTPGTEMPDVSFMEHGANSNLKLTPLQTVPPFQDAQLADKKRADINNVVRLEGLKPITVYQYTVKYPSEEESAIGEFRTAPEQDESAPFKFIAISDAHGGHDKAAKLISKYSPAFVVSVGDFGPSTGPDWNGWMNFFRSAQIYFEKTALMPVLGGHDKSPDNFRNLFALNDSRSAIAHQEGCYYTGVYGNMRYLVLDNYVKKDNMKAQLDWLEKVLSENKAEWTLAFFHEPAFAVGARGQMNQCAAFVDLFEAHGVDIVISGHNHIFERILPLGLPDKKPVHYVAINSSGGTARCVRPSPVIVNGIGQQIECLAEFEVNGNTLTMRIINVNNEAEADRLVLIKQNRMYQREIMEQSITKEYARSIAYIYALNDKPASYPWTKREDLIIEFETKPLPGVKLEGKLDTSRFPIGSKLHVFAGENDQHWQISAKTLEIAGPETAIELFPPKHLAVKDQNFEPKITVSASFEHHKRLFEKVMLEPTLGPKTRALLGNAVSADGH